MFIVQENTPSSHSLGPNVPEDSASFGNAVINSSKQLQLIKNHGASSAPKAKENSSNINNLLKSQCVASDSVYKNIGSSEGYSQQK